MTCRHRAAWIACTLEWTNERSFTQALQSGKKKKKLTLSSYSLSKQRALHHTGLKAAMRLTE